MTLAPPMEDLEILIDEVFDEPHLCESNHCKIVGRGEHEAHLWARLSCGYVYKICRAREYEYSQQKEIHCTKHCGQTVDAEDVETWPIKSTM